jgi:hypothetical protein
MSLESDGGMILTGETEELGEKHMRVICTAHLYLLDFINIATFLYEILNEN